LTSGPSTPISAISGIGPKRAGSLAARGISTLADAIFHLPRRYQDWRMRTPIAQLQPGSIAIIEGDLVDVSAGAMPGRRWRRIVSGYLKTDGRRIRLVWFNIPSYFGASIARKEHVIAYGRVSQGRDGRLEIAHPELHPLDSGPARPIRPVYRLPEQISQRLFASIVERALTEHGAEIIGAIPEELRKATGEPSLADALRELHCAAPDADLTKLHDGTSDAHRALALDEMFAFQLTLAIERRRAGRRAGLALTGTGKLTEQFLHSLPFPLTESQRRAIAEIGADMARPTPMNRMLMGDVGSGKTVVAFCSALRAIESGYQALIMAPTELLAEQHYAIFGRLCASLRVPSALLTGKITGTARTKTLRALASADVPIAFGTQALIQKHVRVGRLGLAIVDEQHRFGVFDRARFKGLGATTDMLLMTATPIPRSLAMTLFAFLDVSFLDELPPGRTPVATDIFTEQDLDSVHAIVRGEVSAGHRAYYIVPLIEGEEDIPSVMETAEKLRTDALKGLRIGVMHGRMKSADKDAVMRQFRDGELDVLVSTTVVEVGIDVPEATVIVVMAAERYGLAQLHQLRGRVGRGVAPSRCCLVASRDTDARACARLEVLAKTASGAEVAAADLRMRGPGDLLGARQTGPLPLRFAHLIRDEALIVKAREMAEQWLARDSDLKLPESIGARQAVARMLEYGFSLADVG
jgi:ATP-dependent DNA helicase RecG